MRHQLGYGLCRVLGEAHIAVRQDSDKLAASLHHRNSRYCIRCHQCLCIGERCLGIDRDRVDHHSAFEPLDLSHSSALLFDGEVTVQHTYATQLRHDYRHPRLRHRVHRRRQYRNIQRNGLGQPRARVCLTGQHIGCCGLQQHVVKCQAEGNFFHAATASTFALSLDSWRPM